MRTQYEVDSQVGWKPRLFRTPYAEHSRATDDISLRLGLVEVFWNVDARDDVPHARVAAIVRNVERRPAARVDHPPARPPSLDGARAAEDPAGDPRARPSRGLGPGAARDRSAGAAAAMSLRFVLVKRALVVFALATAVAAAAAHAAPLPGVKTPTRNISCFYVPIKPTAHGNLLCDIKTRCTSGRCRRAARRGPASTGTASSSRGAEGAAVVLRWRPVRHRPRHADVRRARLRPHVALPRLHLHLARDRSHVHERARPRPVPVARVVPAVLALRARAGRRPSRAGESAAPRRPRRAPPPAVALRCRSTTSQACRRR